MRHPRASACFVAACLVVAASARLPRAAGQPPSAIPLFASRAVLEFDLAAPFDDLFARAIRAPDTTVRGRVSYLDAASGRRVSLEPVEVSVRGNTSRRFTECAFPKLKVVLDRTLDLEGSPFRGARTLKIGTHCDDRPDGQLTFQFGRWANDKSPTREALVYRLLEVADVAVPRTRLARITYLFQPAGKEGDSAGGRSITRHALLLEDEADSFARLHATGELIVPGGEPASHDRAAGTFDNAERQFPARDSARVAFAQAMVGNFDWALKFHPGDGYRDDGRKGLWNVLALSRADHSAFPFVYDFDLSGIVTGRHVWFESVFPDRFGWARSPAAVEVLAQVQRTRSLFGRAVLDDMRRTFLARRDALLAAVSDVPLDAGGRANAEAYLGAFFEAIAADETFYSPVVTRTDVVAFKSAEASQPWCDPAQRVPIGTPVAPAPPRPDGLVEVALLDVFWHWAGGCPVARPGPAWIRADSIETGYPAR
jgi:hypothetical protein